MMSAAPTGNPLIARRILRLSLLSLDCNFAVKGFASLTLAKKQFRARSPRAEKRALRTKFFFLTRPAGDWLRLQTRQERVYRLLNPRSVSKSLSLKGNHHVLNTSITKLEEAALEAFDKATASPKDSRRWQNAIARAWKEFQTNPYIEWMDGELLILSSSNEIYRANGKCRTDSGRLCPAFAKGFPCWHRAAARIVSRCLETSH
jgi:hypothetical protein